MVIVAVVGRFDWILDLMSFHFWWRWWWWWFFAIKLIDDTCIETQSNIIDRIRYNAVQNMIIDLSHTHKIFQLLLCWWNRCACCKRTIITIFIIINKSRQEPTKPTWEHHTITYSFRISHRFPYTKKYKIHPKIVCRRNCSSDFYNSRWWREREPTNKREM